MEKVEKEKKRESKIESTWWMVVAACRMATSEGYRGRGACRIRYAKCTGHGDPLRRVEKKVS